MVTKKTAWLSEILPALESRGAQVYMREELLELAKNSFQDSNRQISDTKILETLLKHGVRLVDLRPTKRSRKTHQSYKPIRRFTWGSPSSFKMALALRAKSYLSHGTAAEIHEILKLGATTVYVNKEQSSKPPGGGVLTQENVDRAFKNDARTSNYIYAYSGHQIVLLSGKQTGNVGVITKPEGPWGSLMLTGLERTLIDITVRPQYAGGVERVVEAFRAAANAISLRVLAEIFEGLGYRYPYHQSIGFYLNRSGFSESDTELFLARGVAMDFYLTHKMVNPLYDSKWRVYYPRLLD